MKKVIITLMAFGLTVALINNAAAQGPAPQAIEATATIFLPAFVFDNVSNVDFGNVEQGLVAEINAGTGDATTSTNSSTGDAGRGSVTIDGGLQDYTIKQTTNPVLSDGSNTLVFETRYSDGFVSGQLTTDIKSAGGYTKTGGGETALTIGGQLAAAGTTGTYNTTNFNGANLVLTVEYSGL